MVERYNGVGQYGFGGGLIVQLPAAYRLHTGAFLPITASTNDDAKALAAAAAPHGTIVAARQQTGGRGVKGSWVSPVGNLYMSLLLRPPVAAKYVSHLTYVTALALYDTVCGMIDPYRLPAEQFQLKWPNDLLWQGKKIAGILVETTHQPTNADWVVVGVGVNVAVAPPVSDPRRVYEVASLRDAGVTDISVDETLGLLTQGFEARYQRWVIDCQQDNPRPTLDEWYNRAQGREQPATMVVDGQPCSGIFRGLHDNGTPRLECVAASPFSPEAYSL